MSTKAKIWIAVILTVVVIIGGLLIYRELTYGNRQMIDMKNRFDRAIIALPDGTSVEGKVNSWIDYSNSDVVQVTIEGKTYLTSYVNVVLIND